MASKTLSNVNDKWPDGTSVAAYARDAFGNATGAAVDTQAVASNAVTFTGLTAGAKYVATALGKTVAFAADPAAAGAVAASAVTFTPAGTIGATNAQAAIEEVASEAGSGGAIGLVTALHKALGLAFDPIHGGSGNTPSAGVGQFIKVPIERAGTISTVLLEIFTAGTGATALANCFVGVYNKAGTLIGKSADQSVSWATAGMKAVAVTAEAGQSLAVVPAAGEFVTVEFHVGTQSTTNVQMLRSTNTAARANANISVAADYRFGSANGPYTTAPPATVPTLAQNVAYWAGVA